MAKKSFTDIFDAARKGTVEDMEYLVAEGADINAEDADGWTPLDIAKGKGNEAVANYLNCAKGKGDTELDKYLDAMRTRLFTKVEQAEIDCFCKAYGNDVHAVDENGEPFLLHEAAAYWDVAVVRYLISQGADVHAINGGFTPLMAAIAENADHDVWYYLYIETVGYGFRSEDDPHDDLIAFAKEMGNKEVAKSLTFTVEMLRSAIPMKDGLMKLLETQIAFQSSDIDGGTRRKLIEGTLRIIECIVKYFVELNPKEIDLLRRARNEL